MKYLLPFSLIGLLSGCVVATAPIEKAHYNKKVATMRSEALQAKDLPAAIQIHETVSPAFSSAQVATVVVLARAPEPATDILHSLLPAEMRQPAETALLEALFAQGYRSASRLNVPAILADKTTFPPRRMTLRDLLPLFKGNHMLVLTVNRFSFTPDVYKYKPQYIDSTFTANLGNHASANITAELVDADTSETVWASSATLDQRITADQSPLTVLAQVVRSLGQKIPQKLP